MDTAAIPAAVKIASLPPASSGAWNLISPRTFVLVTSVSPVAKVKTAPTPLFPVVLTFLRVSPVSAT